MPVKELIECAGWRKLSAVQLSGMLIENVVPVPTIGQGRNQLRANVRLRVGIRS